MTGLLTLSGGVASVAATTWPALIVGIGLVVYGHCGPVNRGRPPGREAVKGAPSAREAPIDPSRAIDLGVLEFIVALEGTWA